jgi:ABC-type phosphate/phosphonate transport system substrate-binding protein
VPRTILYCIVVIALSFTAVYAAGATKDDLVLGVAPVLDEKETRARYQPLCKYLTSTTKRPCRVATQPNFFAYWNIMRRGGEFNLILDDAHFTDYRVQKMNYTVLAKFPYTVTYSLAIPRDSKIDDPARLTGRRIATLGIPSMGAALLNGLFPQPSKQPIPVEVDNANEGLTMLREGKVAAALMPTAIVREEITRGAALRVLLSTVPIPDLALSTAPELPAELRQQIRDSLLNAHKTEAGRSMLGQLGIERFDAANATVYRGQARLLQEFWGY